MEVGLTTQLQKKVCLRNTIIEQLDLILNGVEQTGDLNHFGMIVSNHDGTVQVERIQKDRVKAY